MKVDGDGKHDVTADYSALLLEELLDGDHPSPDIVAILDGVAAGKRLTMKQREQVRGFEQRLRARIDWHNAHGHGK